MDQEQRATEERIAHLERVVEDLSDIVREQADRLDRMERVIQALIDRDPADEAPAADVRPPHW